MMAVKPDVTSTVDTLRGVLRPGGRVGSGPAVARPDWDGGTHGGHPAIEARR